MAPIAEIVDEVVHTSDGVSWSICIRSGPEPLADHRATDPLWTASVGKVLLLLETARRMESDPGVGDTVLSRHSTPPVAEAGLWQHLQVADLSINDLAVLVGSVSDNLAHNVLLTEIGLASVTRLAEDLGLVNTRLLDFVRTTRTGADPPNMSRGSADELCTLMAGLAAGSVSRPGAARRVAGWLRLSTDLSMIGCAFDLDPLSHGAGPGVAILNKTGGDAGVRADAGVVSAGPSSISYAVIANWPSVNLDATGPVLRAIRRIGFGLRAHLDSAVKSAD